MGERRPAQFSDGGLPNDTKFNRVPGIVELGDVSFHVREPITNEDDEVRHDRSKRYREEEQKRNSKASASFEITAGGSDQSDVIA